MKFFKKYPSLIGVVFGLIVVIIFLCSAGNSCIRKDSEGIPRFNFFGTLFEAFYSGIIGPFKIFFYIEGSFFKRLWVSIRSFSVLHNPWFVIPICVVLSNVIFTQLAKKYKKLEWMMK